MARKKIKRVIPDLVPVDDSEFYKKIAEKFGYDEEVIRHVVRMNYKFIRKFFKENDKKGDRVKLRGIGYFEAYKDRPTIEGFYAKAKIMAIISRYNNFRIFDADVEVLKEFASKKFGIPYYDQIIRKGRRWKEGQVPIPEIFETHPHLWKHLEKPPEEPQVMNMEDSVVTKYKDEEYMKDDEFEVF